MPPVYRICSPAALAELAEAHPWTTAIELHLVLFDPLLEDSSIFLACQNPDSRYMRVLHNGVETRGALTNNHYLDLAALLRAWREVWRTFPTTGLDTVMFDVRLPASRTDEPLMREPWKDVTELHWSTRLPSTGGCAITDREPRLFVQTLGTTMMVRSKQRVKFGAIEPQWPYHWENDQGKQDNRDFQSSMKDLCKDMSRPEG